ncbi:MAG: hypothetical protein WCF03_03515 [Nitrososphaeraceae archaeon]|jgi:hypothetical protein
MNDKIIIIVIFLVTTASIMALLPHRAAVFGASMKWPLQTDGIFIWSKAMIYFIKN